jgi:hypothetical protein
MRDLTRRGRLLAAGLAFVVAETTAAGCASDRPTDPRVSERAGGTASSPAGHRDPGLSDEDPVPPPQDDARRVVAGFAAAWVRRDADPAVWWAGVAAWSTPAYAEALRSVDPGAVPAGEVTGTPRRVRGGRSPWWELRTDAGILAVRTAVTTTDTGALVWRVCDVTFTRTAGSAGSGGE